MLSQLSDAAKDQAIVINFASHFASQLSRNFLIYESNLLALQGIPKNRNNYIYESIILYYSSVFSVQFQMELFLHQTSQKNIRKKNINVPIN